MIYKYYILEPSNLALKVHDRVFLVFQWVQDLMVTRICDGGLDVPPPIATRMFQELSNGMLGFNAAYKIRDTPFPFPYVQLITLSLLILCLTAGFVVSFFIDSLIFASGFAFMAVGCYFAINEVAVELEDPFGGDINDLPMITYQHEFNSRLMMIAALNNPTYATPNLDPEIEELYNNIEDDFDFESGATTLYGQANEVYEPKPHGELCHVTWVVTKQNKHLEKLHTTKALANHVSSLMKTQGTNGRFDRMPTQRAFQKSPGSSPKPNQDISELISDAGELVVEANPMAGMESQPTSPVSPGSPMSTASPVREDCGEPPEDWVSKLTLTIVKAQKLKVVQKIQGESPFVVAKLFAGSTPSGSAECKPDEDAGSFPNWSKWHRNVLVLLAPTPPLREEVRLELHVLNGKV